MKSAPRQSLADDPSFLSSLDDLNGGLPRGVNDARRVPSALPRSSSVADVVTSPPKEALTYEDYYGLNEKPFGQSADPRFFYHSTSHDEVAQQLLTAIRRREGIVILTGDVGTGKTTLCRAVVEQLDRRTLTSLVLDPRANTEELLTAVLADFGVISPDDLTGGARATRRELSATLRQFLTSLVPLQAFAVIIIDSAHNLAVDVLQHLRMLSDIVSQDRLLQVVLVGDPALVEHVGGPELQQLAQRVTVRCRLEPLVENELSDYLSYRLGVAGCTTHMPFDDKAQARLHELSGGNPRAINLLCDRALTLGWTARSAVIDSDLVDRAAADLQLSTSRAFETQPLAHAGSASDPNSSESATFGSRFRSRLRGWLS